VSEAGAAGASGGAGAAGAADAAVRDLQVRDLLVELSEAFTARDVERLLRQFSARAEVMYAGSEDGEQAVGPGPLRALLTAVLARPETYAFELRARHVVVVGAALAVLATGTGTEIGPAHEAGASETFRYRVVGTLVVEDSRWVWLLLSGSEPGRE